MKKHFLTICLLTVITECLSAAPVVAQQQADDKYELKVGHLAMTIDAAHGAKILSFRHDNTEVLSQSRWPESFGSTFWTSPQKEWNWPPVQEFDKGAYTVVKEGGKLTMTSEVSAKLKYRVRKTFATNPADESVSITYSIINESGETRQVAPWEITRVPNDGVIFFDATLDGITPAGLLPMKAEHGAVWYQADETNQNRKINADGKGWLAYCANGLLLVKKFQDLKAGEPAPGEAEVQVYVNRGKTYIEIESQGAYTTLKPNESLSWTVKWYLQPVKEPAAPAASLVEKVKGLQTNTFTLYLHPDSSANVVCFLPEKPSGKAIVGVPGGGYSVLSNTHEGTMWANWLNERGIAYFVVNYRLPNGDRTLPMSDVQNTIRMVRDSAAVWHINPHDVGIMGFSAGGHLSSVVSTLSEFDARPDFSILFYPVISMDERLSHVWSCRNFLGEDQKNPEMVKMYSTQNAVRRHLTPPALIITANDDRLVPPATNAIAYYTAMRNAGNECALYVYPTGDHGFGFGPWFKYHNQLLTDMGNWLDARQAPKADAIRVACIGNSITDGHGIDMCDASGYPALLQRSLGKDYWVKNFGVSARTQLNKGDFPYMNEMSWRDALAFKPDIVVIKLGTNDSKPHNWQYAAEFKHDLQQMITALRPDLAQPAKKSKKSKKAAAQPAGPKIYLCTPIPALKPSWDISDSVIVNGIIPIQQEVAREYGLDVIDLHTDFGTDSQLLLDDGIHPNDKGVRRLAEIISAAIKQ